jgi:succinate-semialdehyde dehydrogenase/glutarate-semialdehyde dehydrogenase
VAAKRILVHRSLYERFRAALIEATAALRVGDPMLPDTDVGPLATGEARDRLAEQVDRAVGQGATVLVGGTVPEAAGAFYLPTILEAAPAGAPSRSEELFGPVALLYAFDDIDQAIAIANETPFGLGSSVWTHDAAEQARFVADLDCGMTFFNSVTASDPRVPFGGIKRSGFGRELGKWGMLEFVNVRTVVAAG